VARLYVVGLSHKTAPIEVREPFAFADGAIKPALAELLKLPGVAEAMLISTCNRVELYAGIDGNEAPGAVERFLIDRRGLSTSLRAHLYMHDGEPAVRHLFRVAASLDSMVVGESQILGQVKEAYGTALEVGSLGPILTRTLPRAFAAAKRVRSETQVARSSASVASAAVDLAAQIFGDLKGRDVLVVGAGKMGDLSARHLKASGIGALYVVNRTLERAQELAARLGGKSAPWEDLDKLLAKVDIVLCSTGAAEPVIRRDRIEKVMRARRGRWLFLIDIAVPRDVDPAVGDVENVYLYDVDALQKVVEDNLAGRAREAQDAHAILEQELTRFFALELSLGVVPTIKLLRSRFIEVAHAEAERTLGKLQNASDKDKAQVKALAESIVNKLLHAPLTALKKAAADDPDSELADTVRALFDLHTGHTEEISLDLADAPVPIKTGQEG
jgi:glutamyl-tRNA reductase